MSLVTLPFYADETALPHRLPSLDEIDVAAEVLSDHPTRRVVAVGEHFVVKYGLDILPLEGQTMLYLKAAITLPIPKVYALFQDQQTGRTYLVMERIRGQTLNACWPALENAHKQRLSDGLHAMITELRTLSSPGGYCSVGGQGLYDSILCLSGNIGLLSGPYDTESDLNKAIIARYRDSTLPSARADFYERSFERVFKNHPPIFSHGDFTLKNIMLRSTIETPNDSLDIVLIDWEYAGWYPSYWEYARALLACRWKDDWSYWLDQILDPATAEYGWIHMFMSELCY